MNALRTTRRRKGETDRRRDPLERLVIVVPVSRRAVCDGLEVFLGADVLTPQDRIGDVDLDSLAEVHLYELDDVVVLEGGGDVWTEGVVSEEEPLGNVDRFQHVAVGGDELVVDARLPPVAGQRPRAGDGKGDRTHMPLERRARLASSVRHLRAEFVALVDDQAAPGTRRDAVHRVRRV